MLLRCALFGLEPLINVGAAAEPHWLPVELILSPKLMKVTSLRQFQEAPASSENQASSTARKSPSRSETTSQPPAAVPRLMELLRELAAAAPLGQEWSGPLQRDGLEAEICLKHGAYKAALILCGSILECVLLALLLGNVRRAQDRFNLLPGKQRRRFPEDASLPDLVALARSDDLKQGVEPMLTDLHEPLTRFISSHRDLVHPHAEVREDRFPIDMETAMVVEAGLRVLLKSVKAKIEDGWLRRFRDALEPKA